MTSRESNPEQRGRPAPHAEPGGRSPAQGAGDRRDPDRRGPRLRTWLIGLLIAAVGAALTDVVTGGISAGLKSGWRLATGESAPLPLAVTAQAQRGRRSAFVLEKRLSAASPLPTDAALGRPRIGWAEANGAIDANQTTVQVVIEGRRTASVVLLGLSVDVVERRAPPAGTFVAPEGAGGIGVRYFEVNLDETSPTVESGTLNEPKPEERPIDFPYKVSRTEPEVFIIYASTTTCDCRWTAELSWVSGGKRGTTRIDDDSRPFRTASADAAPDAVEVDRTTLRLHEYER